MKATGLIAILFAASTALAQTTSAESSVTAKIAALESAWNEAYKMEDSKALENLLDDAFLFVGSRGQLRTKSEVLLAVKDSLPPTTVLVPESITTRLHGRAAIVSGLYTEGDKSHAQRGRFIDMWVFKGDRWVCVASQSTPRTASQP